MPKFSANLGFLWTELSLPDAIHAAKSAGFCAVECHWPYEYPTSEVASALKETGLPMLSLNTARGDVAAGEIGLSAVPDRRADAQNSIEQAIDYASEIRCNAVHVLAGFSEGQAAHQCFIDNLRFACQLAEHRNIKILIEPLNRYDAPGYFLQTTNQAVEIIEEVGKDNLKLMFDCYHVYLMEGDLTNRIAQLFSQIGHIQFAGAPGRGCPDTGEVNYLEIFRRIDELGYTGPLGAEYDPNGNTDETLSWLTELVCRSS